MTCKDCVHFNDYKCFAAPPWSAYMYYIMSEKDVKYAETCKLYNNGKAVSCGGKCKCRNV